MDIYTTTVLQTVDALAAHLTETLKQIYSITHELLNSELDTEALEVISASILSGETDLDMLFAKSSALTDQIRMNLSVVREFLQASSLPL